MIPTKGPFLSEEWISVMCSAWGNAGMSVICQYTPWQSAYSAKFVMEAAYRFALKLATAIRSYFRELIFRP